MSQLQADNTNKVLGTLRGLANTEGIWWGTKGAIQSEIARRAEVSDRAALYSINVLLSLGVIDGPTKVHRRGERHGRLRWRLLLPHARIVIGEHEELRLATPEDD